MILGTPPIGSREVAVRSGCAAAFNGTVGDVRALVQATAVLLDEIGQAAPAAQQAVQARLSDLVDVQTQIQFNAAEASAQLVAGVAPRLCAIAAEADRIAESLALQSSAVDQAHRSFWDLVDALRVPPPVAVPEGHNFRTDLTMIAGGALVAVVGVVTLLSPRRI